MHTITSSYEASPGSFETTETIRESYRWEGHRVQQRDTLPPSAVKEALKTLADIFVPIGIIGAISLSNLSGWTAIPLSILGFSVLMGIIRQNLLT